MFEAFSITREPELQDWLSTKKVSDRMACPATDEIRAAMDRCDERLMSTS